jgi:hypothetical protein
MFIWHNFLRGLILAFLRMNEQTFPKNRGSLQDAAAIPLKAMVSIKKWMKEIWNLRNSRMKLEIRQDPRTMSPWNAYFQVLNFPACIGPVRSLGNTVSDDGDMNAVDTSTSAVPSNIGSSLLSNTSEATYNTNATLLLAPTTVPKSPPAARLPGTTFRTSDNSTEKEGKKKRKISYPESGQKKKDQMDSTGFI